MWFTAKAEKSNSAINLLKYLWVRSLIIDDYPLYCISENPVPLSQKYRDKGTSFLFFSLLNVPMWSGTRSQWVNEGFCVEIWESLQQWLMGRGRVGRFCSWQRELIQALPEITGARAALHAPHGHTCCGRERERDVLHIQSFIPTQRNLMRSDF